MGLLDGAHIPFHRCNRHLPGDMVHLKPAGVHRGPWLLLGSFNAYPSRTSRTRIPVADTTNPTPDAASQPLGKRGGPDFHKPGCRCNACVARRRKAEAVLGGNGPAAPPASEAVLAPVDRSNVLTDTPLMGTDVQRHRVKMWLQWKALEPKLTHAEAAQRLGIAGQTLTNLLHRATKEGWLQFDNPMDELEYKQIPMVNEVINYHLHQGDKDVAVKMAQATIWKQYAASKGITDAPSTVLALKIEMPAGITAADVPIKGVIVGQPRTIDAEVIDKDSE